MQAFAPGIYPRSEELVQATRDLDRGRTSQEAVDAQVERDLAELVSVQQSAGIDLLADGMLRWQDVFRPLVEAADGLEKGALTRFLDTNTFYRAPSAVEDAPKLAAAAERRLHRAAARPAAGHAAVAVRARARDGRRRFHARGGRPEAADRRGRRRARRPRRAVPGAGRERRAGRPRRSAGEARRRPEARALGDLRQRGPAVRAGARRPARGCDRRRLLRDERRARCPRASTSCSSREFWTRGARSPRSRARSRRSRDSSASAASRRSRSFRTGIFSTFHKPVAREKLARLGKAKTEAAA